MPAHDPAQRSYVSQIAARKRWGTDTTQARQALKLSRAEDYVRKLVAEAPPLTAEQRDRLALLLRGGAAAGAGTLSPPGGGRAPADSGTACAVTSDTLYRDGGASR